MHMSREAENPFNKPDVIDRWSEIVGAVGERAVRSVFHAEPAVVRVVDTHPGLVVLQVVSTLSVPGGTMQILATVIRNKKVSIFYVRFYFGNQHFLVFAKVILQAFKRTMGMRDRWWRGVSYLLT